jgi:hypothetical protein
MRRWRSGIAAMPPNSELLPAVCVFVAAPDYYTSDDKHISEARSVMYLIAHLGFHGYASWDG